MDRHHRPGDGRDPFIMGRQSGCPEYVGAVHSVLLVRLRLRVMSCCLSGTLNRLHVRAVRPLGASSDQENQSVTANQSASRLFREFPRPIPSIHPVVAIQCRNVHARTPRGASVSTIGSISDETRPPSCSSQSGRCTPQPCRCPPNSADWLGRWANDSFGLHGSPLKDQRNRTPSTANPHEPQSKLILYELARPMNLELPGPGIGPPPRPPAPLPLCPPGAAAPQSPLPAVSPFPLALLSLVLGPVFPFPIKDALAGSCLAFFPLRPPSPFLPRPV
jgi:hypothetical protein